MFSEVGEDRILAHACLLYGSHEEWYRFLPLFPFFLRFLYSLVFGTPFDSSYWSLFKPARWCISIEIRGDSVLTLEVLAMVKPNRVGNV